LKDTESRLDSALGAKLSEKLGENGRGAELSIEKLIEKFLEKHKKVAFIFDDLGEVLKRNEEIVLSVFDTLFKLLVKYRGGLHGKVLKVIIILQTDPLLADNAWSFFDKIIRTEPHATYAGILLSHPPENIVEVLAKTSSSRIREKGRRSSVLILREAAAVFVDALWRHTRCSTRYDRNISDVLRRIKKVLSEIFDFYLKNYYDFINGLRKLSEDSGEINQDIINLAQRALEIIEDNENLIQEFISNELLDAIAMYLMLLPINEVYIEGAGTKIIFEGVSKDRKGFNAVTVLDMLRSIYCGSCKLKRKIEKLDDLDMIFGYHAEKIRAANLLLGDINNLEKDLEDKSKLLRMLKDMIRGKVQRRVKQIASRSKRKR